MDMEKVCVSFTMKKRNLIPKGDNYAVKYDVLKVSFIQCVAIKEIVKNTILNSNLKVKLVTL